MKLLDEISLCYEEVQVLDKFSLEIETGKILCIVGPSGCGKSSILNIIAGLIDNYEGDIKQSLEKISYVFQEDRLLPWETVYNNVRIVKENEQEEEITDLLTSLELNGFGDKYPHQLSGGMRQRCSIARSFYYDAPLLLMDEPFKSIDYDLKVNMINYLINLWQKRKNTIIFVTHDIDEALLLGHKIMVLSKRPTRIIDIYDVKKAHTQRDLTDIELSDIRNKIIKNLTKGE